MDGRTKSHLAKLTAAEVRELRKLKLAGWSQTDLAVKFKVSQVTVHNILKGIVYTHVK